MTGLLVILDMGCSLANIDFFRIGGSGFDVVRLSAIIESLLGPMRVLVGVEWLCF